MDRLNHPVARGASWLLIYLIAVQPLHPAIAAGINAAGGSTQVRPGNIPVVNIAAPNGSGVSHNKFTDFSVGTSGAVLNNAVRAGRSQLSGQLEANPNLKGKAAELIINEVTGSSRSTLQGKLEVFGTRANVMIANPNGITCDGCGFINTPAVALTTGRPQFDKRGALEALEVRKGVITVGEKGLNGSSQQYVDVISRAVELNGKINAKDLKLTQGTNRINYKDGTVKPISGEGSRPRLAVDTKSLGGMYAGKIRLVATEDGVGVNLRNINSRQGDVTLNVRGRVELSSVHARTDLNVKAQEIHTTAGGKVSARRDVTLAANALDNKGDVTAQADMRVFAETVRNTGKLCSGNSLWIQKDAQGNKAKRVENRSGSIKTDRGDLVVRTDKLENVRNSVQIKQKQIAPNSTSINNLVGVYPTLQPPRNVLFLAATARFKDSAPERWFGHVDLLKDPTFNSARNQSWIDVPGSAAEIVSGRHLYINSTELTNSLSHIGAAQDVILTGNRLVNHSVQTGEQNHWIRFNGPTASLDLLNKPLGGRTYVNWHKTAEFSTWKDAQRLDATIHAGRSLVADFHDAVRIDTEEVGRSGSIGEALLGGRSDSLRGQKVLINAGEILNRGVIRGTKDISLIADKSITLQKGDLRAGGGITLLATGDIDGRQSEIAGQDVLVISRNGSVRMQSDETTRYFYPENKRAVAALQASGDLTVQAGKALLLRDIHLAPQSRSISLSAGAQLAIENTSSALNNKNVFAPLTSQREQELFNSALNSTKLNASENISLSGAGGLALNGIRIAAGKDVSLYSGQDASLNMRTLDEQFRPLFPLSRSAELRSQVRAGGSVLIHAARDIGLQGADISAGNSVTALAGQDINMPAFSFKHQVDSNLNNIDHRHVTPHLKSGKNLTLAANRNILTAGSRLSSGGDATLTSGGNMRFEPVVNKSHRVHSKGYSEQVTQQSSELDASGLLTLSANGSILFQATRLQSRGAANLAGTLNVAAKGGYLYAQAMEERSHYEEKKKKCSKWSFCITKKEVTRIRHSVTNKVTEFIASGNINLLSRDDSIYEASKISAGNNARFTSLQGTVNFRAVKNTVFEQTISTSKGFFIKQVNKGYTEGKWVLPSVHTGGQLLVNAPKGISADVKIRNAQTLQNVLSALGNSPETAWLKDLNKRGDVQWNTVQNAYDSWSHKDRSLNPVVAAVIAIAAAAVTAGSSFTAVAASNTAATVGGGAVTSGAVTAGMSALASRTAVSLVENQGNLSNTLNDLGSSDSVKAIVTAMIIGGALSGFDSAMGWNKDAAGKPLSVKDVKLPQLSNGDWGKVAQRVAGQSIISSSLNTTINGGSFKDNLADALMANIGSQIGAEGAKLIGDNGEILGVPGKAVSHAVLAGVSAEIGGGNGKGAAAGALAAELAAISLGDIFVEPAVRENQIQSAGRIIGAITGAAVTNSATGAWSGASAAENTLRYNFLMHDEPAKMAKKLAACGSDGACRARVMKEMAEISNKNIDEFSDCLISGSKACVNDKLNGIDNATGYDALTAQIGADAANTYKGGLGVEAFNNAIDCMGMGWEACSNRKGWKLIESGSGVLIIAGGQTIGGKLAEVIVAGKRVDVNKPLGLGSTGRNTPINLNEKLALEQAISNPNAGRQLPIPMTDKRWPASDGWVKMSQNINGIEVHYVRNAKTGAIDDFKFK